MNIDDILSLAQRRGIIRAADVEQLGVSRTLLPYMARRGMLRRIARGAYVAADRILERETLLEAAAALPHGVICLLSALQFHEITTQMPMEVWMAVERGKRASTAGRLAIRVLRFKGAAFAEGIEEHFIDGAVLRVYSPAKTVVDCFKFRNRVGLDLAREALRDAVAQRKATRDEIWRLAKFCRMSQVMRPYLEMVQ